MGRIEAYYSILGSVEDKKIVQLTELSAPYVSRIRKSLGVDSFSKNLKSLIKAYKVRRYRRSAQALREGAILLRAKEAGKDRSAVLGIPEALSEAFWLYHQIDGRLKDENKMARFNELLAEQAEGDRAAIEPVIVEALLEFLAKMADRELRGGKRKKRGRKQRKDVAAISVTIADLSIEDAEEPCAITQGAVSASAGSLDTEVSVDALSSNQEEDASVNKIRSCSAASHASLGRPQGCSAQRESISG